MKHPALFCLLALALPLSFSQAGTTTHWKGASEIVFSGTSTLHSWSGKVKAEPFIAAVVMTPDGQPEHLEAKVQVKVPGMDTAEPERDVNMRKAMNAEGFPLITATMNGPFTHILDPGTSLPRTLPFDLELLGKKHHVAGLVSNWQAAGKEASFDLDFDLSLKECGITVPSKLLVIRVGDTIKLHSTVKLVRAND
ncbi:MAG: YceI family protein [Verrucomicrobiaceae bacterium]|nr:YceI family protein [Verrucomicrobiaceae bacterium]